MIDKLFLLIFPYGQIGLLYVKNRVLQSLIKVLFLFLEMRGHPVSVDLLPFPIPMLPRSCAFCDLSVIVICNKLGLVYCFVVLR